MRAPYTDWSPKKRDVVSDIAGDLLAARPLPSPLSPFIFMTDPDRVPNPIATVQTLPKGCTVIYRHFGRDGYTEVAKELRAITQKRNQQLLIGHDPELAIAVKADGVHFRRDATVQAPTIWREKQPDWIITMAGLKGEQNYSGDLSVLDGLFISSVFYSKSPSAGDPIGTERLSEIVRDLHIPIVALGGVDKRTAPNLIGTDACALAGIDGLIQQAAP